MKLPQPWATSELYGSGPDVGTPTRVDPASTANGFVRGTAAAAQHVNFNFHPLANTTRRTFTLGCLALRQLDVTEQDDLSDGLAAANVADSVPTVLIKASTSGAVRIMNNGSGDDGGPIAQISGSVVQAERVGTTIVVVGSGGTQNCRTTNNGTGWSAGGATGVFTPIVSIGANGTQFAVVTSAGESAHGTGATWANPGAGDDVSDVLSGPGITSVAGIVGVFVAAGPDGSGDTAFARSTDNGVTWVAASGTVPNAAAQTNAGWVTSDHVTFWHAGYRASTTVDIATSATGNTWSTVATLTSALTVTGVKLMADESSDLLVIAMQHTTNVEVRASTDGGLTWSEPEYLQGFVLAGLAVANGRLWASKGGRLFGSDGVGAE